MECLDPDFGSAGLSRGSVDKFVHPTSKALARTSTKRTSGQHVHSDSEAKCVKLSRSADLFRTTSAEQQMEVNQSAEWWIARSCNLPPNHRNGWVVSLILEQYSRESDVASILNKATFVERMMDAGLEKILGPGNAPRDRCKALLSAGSSKLSLTCENAQRMMIKSIERSTPAYISGIRCWAAYCDGLGDTRHFPAQEEYVIRYVCVFHSWSTMNQYMKHLRWAHRFLHMSCKWETPSVKQAMHGLRKCGTLPKEKLALHSKAVAKIVLAAEDINDVQMAALIAISRLFLFRVPSEAIPLEWDGSHSKVDLKPDSVSITLMRRKNTERPTLLERQCCCRSSGKALCAVHCIFKLQRRRTTGRVFTISAQRFMSRLRELAERVHIPNAAALGSHSLRRGMAQDIISQGGGYPCRFVKSSGWNSRAFMTYLRDTQAQDEAISQMVVNLSDSDAD